VVAQRGKIFGRGWNRVISTHDPTAHAEIIAIRAACRRLKLFRLDDCELCTSCEPYPMCLPAIFRSRVKRIYYGNARQDAAKMQFDDDLIHREEAQPISDRKLPMNQLLREETIEAFAE
jgi:guanine deaminase